MLNTEAAAETIFENICYFLPEAHFSRQEALCVHRTDTNFSGRFIYSSNVEQIKCFQGGVFVRRTDTDFPGRFFQISSYWCSECLPSKHSDIGKTSVDGRIPVKTGMKCKVIFFYSDKTTTRSLLNKLRYIIWKKKKT